MRSAVVLFLAPLVLMPGRLVAQPADVKGSRDNPLVSRYAGSYVAGYEAREYGELTLALGPSKQAPNFRDFEYSKKEHVEGKLTRILYVTPGERTSLEIFRNYESALKQAGFTTLFSCSEGGCDDAGNPARFLGIVYGLGGARRLKNTPASAGAFSSPKEARYLAAKLTRPEGAVYVSLLVAIETSDAGGTSKEILNRPLALLEIVETKAMERGMVTVSADAMSRDIARTGHVALYGIYFDTDSDAIKPQSEPTLAEIAKLLKQTPQRLYVVGHTDNVGGYEHNITLSQRRADSVAKYLISKYGADAKVLRSVGVGPVTPVAPNDSEDGRAKNRRVELVTQ